MILENLRTFVSALHAANGDRVVDMLSIREPACGTPGCHAGESWLAMNRIEGLENPSRYEFGDCANFLSRYLLGPAHSLYDLRSWAEINENLWGNDSGFRMFVSPKAFGFKAGENFPSSVIAEHWQGVLNRYEQSIGADITPPPQSAVKGISWAEYQESVGLELGGIKVEEVLL